MSPGFDAGIPLSDVLPPPLFTSGSRYSSRNASAALRPERLSTETHCRNRSSPSWIQRCGEWKRAATCVGISSSCKVAVCASRNGVKRIASALVGIRVRIRQLHHPRAGCAAHPASHAARDRWLQRQAHNRAQSKCAREDAETRSLGGQAIGNWQSQKSEHVSPIRTGSKYC